MYVLFVIIMIRSRDLINQPLTERKKLLFAWISHTSPYLVRIIFLLAVYFVQERYQILQYFQYFWVHLWFRTSSHLQQRINSNTTNNPIKGSTQNPRHQVLHESSFLFSLQSSPLHSFRLIPNNLSQQQQLDLLWV
jgi:hypothetical protein